VRALKARAPARAPLLRAPLLRSRCPWLCRRARLCDARRGARGAARRCRRRAAGRRRAPAPPARRRGAQGSPLRRSRGGRLQRRLWRGRPLRRRASAGFAGPVPAAALCLLRHAVSATEGSWQWRCCGPPHVARCLPVRAQASFMRNPQARAGGSQAERGGRSQARSGLPGEWSPCLTLCSAYERMSMAWSWKWGGRTRGAPHPG